MHLLNDSAAFTVAKSIKLGRDASDSRLPGGKTPYSNTLPPKEKYECVKDADCAGVFICRSNKCIDPCTGVTCPGGQRCSVGKCVSCSRGEACGCTGTTVSSGSGSCFDPCDPNKCVSTTPTCSRSGADYSCACTSTSCGAGKKCSGSSCTNCAVNESCNCPSGQKANGSGGCATVACSSNSDCGAGKQCANAGTTSAYCYNCSANSQCTCPSGQLANGAGGCVKPVCYDNTTCGAGRQCIDPGKYNAKCDPCPSGTQCTCPSGQAADGSGGCQTEQKGCPQLCPDKIVTSPGTYVPTETKGGRWCGGHGPSVMVCGRTCEMKEILYLYDGWISPEAVYVPSEIRDVKVLGTSSVLGNAYVEASHIDGNVIVGSSDCNTPKGSPFVTNSYLHGNVRIYGRSQVDDSIIDGNVQITGGHVTKNSSVSEDAFIGGNATVYSSRISGHAEIYERAQVYNSDISEYAKIYGDAVLFDAKISGNARICNGDVPTGLVLSTCDKRYCSDCP